MTITSNIPVPVYQLLQKKYNILGEISFDQCDYDFDLLKNVLSQLKKTEYDINDKIIVDHMDTDFYFDECAVGVYLRNFFTVAEMLDIPNFVFLFYTNHFGLEQELLQLCKDANDQPMVIESFIDRLHYSPRGYLDTELNLDAITHPALCMINIQRSHRNAMYHVVKSIRNEKVMKSFTVDRDA